ncbi:MAG TPA: NAD+ synthase, partial [Devosia sp.]|nr:NAD+ synthase [Devosia sp.]
GEIKAITRKVDLPNYGVFDDKRVFAVGPMPGPLNVRGVRIGVPICEDIWTPDIVECLSETGSEILLVPNGSPFEAGKEDVRLGHITARVTESGLPLVYLNQIGGQDEIVFDGASLVMNADRSIPVSLPGWQEKIVITHWSRDESGWVCATGEQASEEDRSRAVYHAMVLGLRDYVNKNRFPGVVLGLSGGIDSAVCAAIAVDALGPERVWCVMLPSRFTSQESLDDAKACAEALGCRYSIIPIQPAVEGFDAMLEDSFADTKVDITEENLQSRIRGVTLMALSNKFGPMLVTTGNKSEMSVGYATIYGDMAGGYNPLKDAYKMTVFGVAKWRNTGVPRIGLGPAGEVIPQRIIDKPPSAELRPDQKDEDSLPPYPVLDRILMGLVEHEKSVDQLAAEGLDRATVERIEHLLNLAEYKRRQAPPGVKLGMRNFGRDRRYPITHSFRSK